MGQRKATMKTNKLIGWVFLPDVASEEWAKWVAPKNYFRARHGDVRLRLETDTPLDDTRFFEPGWRRAPHLDGPRFMGTFPEEPRP
jgi:hypothetical protein